MMDKYILDENGEPVLEDDIHVWGRWFEDIDNRRVAYDEKGPVSVSTVFLGLDHRRLGDGGSPLLWESMVFDDSWEGETQERYTSAADAIEGHKALCKEYL